MFVALLPPPPPPQGVRAGVGAPLVPLRAAGAALTPPPGALPLHALGHAPGLPCLPHLFRTLRTERGPYPGVSGGCGGPLESECSH